MSNFYKMMDLDPDLNYRFKKIKREFKRGQVCVSCGKKFKQSKMTVDHIEPVSNPSVDPFDMTNWQVLCIYCHRRKNKNENI